MPDKKNKQKILSFRFLVEVNGVMLGGFSEVSGFEETIETEDYKEGGGDFVHKLPKGIVQSNLKLKRGMSIDNHLWNWFMDCRNSILYGVALEKENIHITIFGETQGTEASFIFFNAYPIKWSGPTLNATNSSVSIEELEFSHEGMWRSK